MAKWIRRVIILVVCILLLACGGIYGLLVRSKPQLEGTLATPELAAPVVIERDALGIPSIYAQSQTDAYYACGFLHAQERFFQMDLFRRSAAGELSALVPGTVHLDKRFRFFQFRKRAQETLDRLSPEDRALLEAYSKGVNHGLFALKSKPFEYHLLRARPEPWKPEDVILVASSFYLDLEGGDGRKEQTLALLQDTLSDDLFRFLLKNGNTWDAPLDDSQVSIIPIPLKEKWTITPPATEAQATLDPPVTSPGFPWLPNPLEERPVLGSNAWAISGSRSHDGRAILANDPHMGLRVPHVFYRVDVHYPDREGNPSREIGVTAPGTPFIPIGTNTHVSWGLTTQNADTEDLVRIIPDPDQADHYLTPEGSLPIKVETETIVPRNGIPETIEIRTTRFGPIVGRDTAGYELALLWSGFQQSSFNLVFSRFHQARNLDQLFDLANEQNFAVQNLVGTDRAGNIGWTCLGWLPDRSGYDGFLPVDSNDPSWSWNGRLSPDQYPRVVNPVNGRIWSANNRMVGEPLSRALGDGQPSFTSRAWVINEALKQATNSSELDMLTIQGNNHAIMLDRWKTLLETTLKESPQSSTDRSLLLQLLATWNGLATTDAVAYRFVREFRLRVRERVFRRLLAPLYEIDPGFRVFHFRYEEPLWLLVSQQPDYLSDLELGSWQAEFDLILDELILYANQQTGGKLNQYTHGISNQLRMVHPISQAVPWLGSFLNMPEEPINGDSICVNAIRIDHGPAFRFVSSPGQESEAILHMPGGQSGHPLSKHYRDQHQAWVNLDPTPLLPGPAVHTLILKPE